MDQPAGGRSKSLAARIMKMFQRKDSQGLLSGLQTMEKVLEEDHAAISNGASKQRHSTPVLVRKVTQFPSTTARNSMPPEKFESAVREHKRKISKKYFPKQVITITEG